MRKNLRSKILLCILAGGVLAANTALAEEYKEYREAILGAEDVGNAYDEIKSNTGNNYTYTFTEDSVIKISGGEYGIAIGEDNTVNTDSITITGTNINIDIVNEQLNTTADGYGISVGAGKDDKTIDMSKNDGIIRVSTISSTNSRATSRGAVLHDRESNKNNTIHIGNAVMELSAYNNAAGNASIAGIYITAGTEHTITMGDGQITGKAVSENGLAEAWGVYDGGTDTNVKLENVPIDILAEGNAEDIIVASGIEKYNAGNVEVGDGDIFVKAINNSVIANTESLAQGIYADIGSVVTKENGKIDVFAEGGKYTTAYGVYANGSTVNLLGIVDINAEAVYDENVDNSANAYGISVSNNGVVNMEGGSISVKDNNYRYAIRNNEGNVNINKDGGNDVVITGNISDSNGDTYLNLDTAKSVLTGAIKTSGGEITLNLKNGATWNHILEYYSIITNLNMNNGIIKPDERDDSSAITIANYSGTGEIVLTAGDNTSNGNIDVDAGRTNITSAAEGSVINMSVTNNNLIGTTDSAQALANLNQIANEISYDDNDGHITGKVTIKEGLIMPEASGDLLFDQNDIGYVANVKQNSSTTTIDNIKNIAATAIVAWRQEDSTLSQRLGELRESEVGQGIWVRMSRGEFEYDGAYKNQYNFFQMGYDWAAGNWHYGAAVSHNDGQTTYTHGDGENRSTSLSLYGTWLGDKGHYADIVLKQGRLSNDFDIYTEAGHTSGDYDAWGTSLSGEYGMKVDLDGGWYVTPQAQLTLMRIGSEDYTTNNGIKVHQDSLESAIGRVGFEVGKRISDSGSIYAKASLLHDFAGSADTYLSHKGLTNSYHQDIGDTWCEAGIGFNYKTSKNSYVYADVVKTFGGDVDTPWQWNAGMRWTF